MTQCLALCTVPLALVEEHKLLFVVVVVVFICYQHLLSPLKLAIFDITAF